MKMNFVSGVDLCMVEGCGYNLTCDIYRLVPGKEGGEYDKDNIFEICLDHHAEFHRGICTFEKINDNCLLVIYGGVAE